MAAWRIVLDTGSLFADPELMAARSPFRSMPVLQAGMADIPGDENAATVLIKHGPVDTFMPGMTMEFHLVTPSDLKRISIGQTVEGDVSRRGDEYWIDHLHPAGAK